MPEDSFHYIIVYARAIASDKCHIRGNRIHPFQGMAVSLAARYQGILGYFSRSRWEICTLGLVDDEPVCFLKNYNCN